MQPSLLRPASLPLLLAGPAVVVPHWSVAVMRAFATPPPELPAQLLQLQVLLVAADAAAAVGGCCCTVHLPGERGCPPVDILLLLLLLPLWTELQLQVTHTTPAAAAAAAA
jgi:hypothetical protein